MLDTRCSTAEAGCKSVEIVDRKRFEAREAAAERGGGGRSKRTDDG